MFENFIIKVLCVSYIKLSTIEQKFLSQKKMNLKRVIKFDFFKIYIVENLNDFETFDRIFRLLFSARFEQLKQQMRIFSHIEYDKLSIEVFKVIAKKMIIEKHESQTFMRFLKSAKFFSHWFYQSEIIADLF